MTKTICFCGIDGCGKTTQAKMLLENLKKMKKEVIYIHILSRRSTTFSSLHEISLISKGINWIRNLKDNFFTATLKISLRLFNLLFDSWITVIVNKIKYKKEIIIYDRYFYDILIILAFSYPKLSNFIMNFAKVIPKPDVVILYEISPEVAVKRKSEHTLDETRKYCRLYRKLDQKINVSLIINANLSKEEIAKNIEHVCSEIIYDEGVI